MKGKMRWSKPMQTSPMILVLLASASLVRPLCAADWPQWRGPARDGRAALEARAAFPEALAQRWKVEVGEGHASPLVVGDRVYVFSREGEEEVVRSLELATGRQVWRQSYLAPYTMNSAAVGHGKGPKSTPSVAGGRVFTFGISGILSCFEAAAGRLVWRQEFSSRFSATSPLYGAAQSPVVDGERVIVHVGGPGRGALTAFDTATGALRWEWTGDGPGYASPVVAPIAGVRQVVVFSESFLVGVSADRGALLWKLPFTTPWVQNAVTPLVDGDTIVYSGLDHPVRAARVVRKADGFATEPRWENAEVSAYMSTPVAEGGRIFGLSQRKRGQLFCLDAATGKVVWLSEGRQGDNAALVSAGGSVLVLTTGGELLVVPQKGDAFMAARRYRVAESPTWAHPVVTADGVLVKDKTTVAYWRF
jgi:outer membrane protein assembly factor BamB